MSIDEIVTALQGRKGRAFDAAMHELMSLADTVDAVRQPQIHRENDEAERNALPGQSVKINCEAAWAVKIRYYVATLHDKRATAEGRSIVIAALKRFAAYSNHVANE